VTNSYMIDRAINCIRGQRHVILPVGKYETSDMELIRFLHSYPSVRFLGSRPSDPTPAPSANLFGPAPEPVTVTSQVGLQMKQKREQGGRVQKADSE
jgi:hypothetical protein